MYLEELLHPCAPHKFFDEFWEKEALYIEGYLGKPKFWHFTWAELSEALRAGVTKNRAVQKGKEYPMQKSASIMEQFSAGRTIVSDSIETAHPKIREIVSEFSRQLGAEVTINIYATPQGEQGFGLHHDPQDVFLLQTHGKKTWRVYKNEEHLYPLEGGTYQDVLGRMKVPETRKLVPYLECTLAPGDTLYIPRGHWHEGSSVETSMHLTLTFVMVKRVDLITLLAKQLREIEFFRKNLPVVLASQSRDGFTMSRDLSEALSEAREEFFRICTIEKFNALWCELTSAGYAANEIFLPTITSADTSLKAEAIYERNPSQRVNISLDTDGFILFCAGQKIWFTQMALPIIQNIFSMTVFKADDLYSQHLDLEHSLINEVLQALKKHFLIREKT